MPEETPLEFPPLFLDVEEEAPKVVQPVHVSTSLSEDSMAMVRRHHPHIGDRLHAIWGYRECGEYLQRLVLTAHDVQGNARVGFKPEVMTALMNLSAMHKVTH